MNNILENKNKFIFWGLMGLFIALSAYSLSKFPEIHNDEATGLKRAWSHITNQKKVLPDFGHIMTEADVSLPKPIKPRQYINLLLFIRIAVVKLCGVNVIALRAISFAFGFLLLSLTYLWAKLLYNKKTAALSVLFLAVSMSFWCASHLSRQEIVLLTYMVGCYYLFTLGIKQNKNYLLYTSLLISILSYGIHQHGIITLPILGLLYIYLNKEDFYKRRFFWVYCTTSIILIILAYFTFPYMIAQLFSYDFHSIRIIYEDFNFLKEFSLYYEYFSHVDWIVIACWLIIFLHRCFRERNSSDICCLIILVVCLLFLTFIVAHNNNYYVFTYYPFAMISIASLVDKYVLNGYLTGVLKKISISAVILIFLFYTGQYIRRVYLYRNYNYYGWMAKVKDSIPPDAVVMGTASFWPALYEHSFYLPFLLVTNPITFNQLMDRIKPDILIINNDFYFRINIYYWWWYKIERVVPVSRQVIIRKEFAEFMANKTKKIMRIEPLETDIYQVNWNDSKRQLPE